MSKQKLDNNLFKPKIEYETGLCYVPEDNKLKPLREDAYFICNKEQTLSVVDSVGGWAAKGMDVGEYARKLMANTIIAIHEEYMLKGSIDLGGVLHEAHFHTKVEESSIACILTFKAGLLHAMNVGDSGFMVFRDAKLVYRSPIQQCNFNCLYQLGNNKTSDRPDMAMELVVKVNARDIMVLGIDGQLNNMYPTKMEEILKRETKEQKGSVCLKKVASLIREYALHNLFNKFTFSSFVEAIKKARLNHMGSKVNDITVVVGIIQS